jgi:heptosyltransferase I
MRLLVVKTSSLGDVIHGLIPLTDAARAVPGLSCDWVAEEAYAEIPGWHPAVRRVIPCAVRRWRRAPLATWRCGEWRGYRDAVRGETYDMVIDAQGLVKSALLARQARGPKVGRSFGTTRERWAALLYDRRIAVDLRQSQVERLRELFARALGYPQPRTPPEFGLDARRFVVPAPPPYVVLLHGASWPSKLWPEDRWQALGRELAGRGYGVKLPSGTPTERAAAERIASAFGGEVLPPGSLADLATVLASARFVVGNDTGTTHLAPALGVRAVSLHGPSVPVIHEVAGGLLVNLCSTAATTIDRARPNTVPLDAVMSAITPWIAGA